MCAVYCYPHLVISDNSLMDFLFTFLSNTPSEMTPRYIRYKTYFYATYKGTKMFNFRVHKSLTNNRILCFQKPGRQEINCLFLQPSSSSENAGAIFNPKSECHLSSYDISFMLHFNILISCSLHHCNTR